MFGGAVSHCLRKDSMKLRVGAEARFQSGAGGRQALAAPVQAKKPLQARDESPGLVFSRQPPFFVSLAQKPKVREFIFSPLMADICRATVGDTAVLAFEQFVVKAAEKGMKFAWHQDSGYVQTPHKPYVTCWCTLDDVTEENGTVYVLPYDRAGTRERVEHVKDEKTNDLVGYFGDDLGVPIIVPAGSIAVFASTVFHRSGPNTTSGIRRIFLPQYSAAPVLGKDGKPQYLAEPFLEEGKMVAQA